MIQTNNTNLMISKSYNRQYHTLSVRGTNGDDFYDYERDDRARYRRNGSNPSIWIEAGDGDDVIFGSDEGWETIHGEGGNDWLWLRGGGGQAWGGDGNDVLVGGTGGDSLLCGTGDDRAFGGRGRDYLRGDEGNDFLSAGEDDDRLAGGIGNDVIHGGEGIDTVIFGTARSRVRYTVNLSNQNWQNTGEGSDKLIDIENVITRQGNDLIIGNESRNNIRSGSGNDVVLGLDGDDEINAQHGDDFIIGGRGFDDLFGGEGADNFILTEGFGVDFIKDFGFGDDKIIVGGAGIGEAFEMFNFGTAVVLSQGDDMLALISNANIDELNVDGNVITKVPLV